MAMINLVMAIAPCVLLVLKPDRKDEDVEYLLKLAYVLSRQVRKNELQNLIEKLLVPAINEFCVDITGDRNLQWAFLSFQQALISTYIASGGMEELKKSFPESLAWIGAVLFVTNNKDSDSWGLGLKLMNLHPRNLGWDGRIQHYHRYLWTDDFTARLEQRLGLIKPQHRIEMVPQHTDIPMK